MDLHKIGIFLEVVRKRSFVKAAETLRLDPSVVSRAVSVLENDLGAKLFLRTTRKLAPTEVGRAFFSQVEPLVEELNRARNFVRDQRSKPKGVLRLTTPVSFGVLVLNPILLRFQAEFPDIEIEVIVSDGVLDLADHQIDVAIRFGHLDSSSYIATKVANLDYIICASPKYLERSAPVRRPDDVRNHRCLPFLLPRFESTWRFRSRRTAAVEQVPIRSSLRISSALAIKDAALAHAGLAMLPSILVRRELAKGSLVQLLPSYEATGTEFGAGIWLVHPSREYVPAKIRLFLEFMKKAMAAE